MERVKLKKKENLKTKKDFITTPSEILLYRTCRRLCVCFSALQPALEYPRVRVRVRVGF